MAIDTYALCPGGTGKKIKFCCADLVGDLEQLDTLVEGDQISAALDQVKRLEEKHPRRACLMATRTKLELASKRYDESAASSKAFLDAFRDRIAGAFPAREDGVTLFPFQRMFMVATRL
jgi:hypothetical protein